MHRELRELADEVGKILDLGEPEVALRAARVEPSRSLVNELRGVLLRGLRGR